MDTEQTANNQLGQVTPQLDKWTRSENGWVAGLCERLGEITHIHANWFRLTLVISLFFYGTGFFIYLIPAIALPRKDRINKAYQDQFLGVCRRIALRSGADIGLVRLIALFLFFSSFGLGFIAYFVLHFALQEGQSKSLF